MKALFALAVTTAVLSVIVLRFAYSAYPPLQNDSVFYWPPIINVAAGRGLINQVEQEVHRADPTGQDRFMLYPALEAIVLGRILYPADGGALYRLYGCINVLKLILMALVLFLLTMDAGVLAIACACAGLVSLASMEVYHLFGRPEEFAQIFVLLAMLVIHVRDHLQRGWIFGFLVALMALCHPIGALMLMACVMIFESYRDYPFESLLIALVSGIVTLAIAWHSWPFPVCESLAAIADHGFQIEQRFRTTPNLWGMFMTDYGAFGELAVLCVMAYAIVAFWWKKRPRNRAINAAGIGLLGSLIWHFILPIPPHIYYMNMFVPMMVAFLVWWMQKEKSEVFSIAVFLALMISCGSLARFVQKFPYYSDYSFIEAHRSFNSEYANYAPHDFYATGSLFALANDFTNVKEDGADPEHYRGNKYAGSILLLQRRFLNGKHFPFRFGDFSCTSFCDFNGWGFGVCKYAADQRS